MAKKSEPIPYGKQFISEEDIRAVVDTLRGDFLTQGPRIREFEESFARYTDAKYAVAVSNGTAALHLAALALDIKPGDKILSTPITFAASVNCIRYCGGEVVFADIDPETLVLDIRHVRKLLESHPEGTFKGIIPVDFAGYPVNMEEFRKLADEYKLWIIEDACHSPGAWFTDSAGRIQKCGNGKYVDMTVFSFHPVKHIATGEGGMITTNNERLYQKLLALRTHGITKNPDQFVNPISLAVGSDEVSDEYPGWYMEMQTLGYNYRITDFQAALGSSQLNKAEERLERRNEIALMYDKAFRSNPHIVTHTQHLNEKVCHAFHLYVIQVRDRLGLYKYLRENNIFAQVHYFPAHLMPYYRQLGWKPGDFPVAEKYYAGCLSIPMYPSLTDEQVGVVADTVLSFPFQV